MGATSAVIPEAVSANPALAFMTLGLRDSTALAISSGFVSSERAVVIDDAGRFVLPTESDAGPLVVLDCSEHRYCIAISEVLWHFALGALAERAYAERAICELMLQNAEAVPFATSVRGNCPTCPPPLHSAR